MSAIIKAIDTPSIKLLLHKDESSLGKKCVWNYREAVGMLGYLQRSTRPEISMALHQWAHFCNNPRLLHERNARLIAKYLTSTSTYMDLPDINLWLTTCGVVYKPDIEKGIKC